MKRSKTLVTLLTVAAAGVGVASGQFTTSRVAASALAPRGSSSSSSSNAAALVAARQEEQDDDFDTVRQTVTRTVVQNSRTSSSSGRPRPSSSSSSSKPNTSKSNNDDDDSSTTTLKPSTQTTPPATTTSDSTAPSNTLPSTPTPTPSNETPTDGNSSGSSGLSAGAAAGIAAGAVACVAIIAAVAFLLWRRRQGGIRGAVVTGEYPRGMSMDMNNSSNNGGGTPKGGEDPFSYGAGAGMNEVEGGDLGDGRRGGGSGSGSGGVVFLIPPAGTMPGEPGFEGPQEGYPSSSSPGRWLGGDLGEARPVSAFTTAYPSPGQPVLPVSPMTPYRPESSIMAAYQQQPQSRVSSYYPDVGSPDLPTYMIPGGNRSRAMSFSSVSNVGGGPRVAEFIGSPPPPVPSIAVVVEGQSPGRQSHLGWR